MGTNTGSASFDQPAYAPLVVGAVTMGTLAVAFSLMALGVEDFWIAFVVGFGGVLPMALGAVAHRQHDGTADASSSAGEEAEAALEELRLRYARGELTDAEFETRVEQLLETESVRKARTHVEQQE